MPGLKRKEELEWEKKIKWKKKKRRKETHLRTEESGSKESKSYKFHAKI